MPSDFSPNPDITQLDEATLYIRLYCNYLKELTVYDPSDFNVGNILQALRKIYRISGNYRERLAKTLIDEGFPGVWTTITTII